MIRIFLEITKGKFGPVQVIVVNHAIYVSESIPVSKMSLEQWNGTIGANLTSPFLVIREYLKVLENLGEDRKELKDKAAIILVGSTCGTFGSAGHADESAAKSGEMASPLACCSGS